MCSGCGWVDDHLTLAERVFRCRTPQQPDCAVVLDRDLNAAINLAHLAGSSSERRNACGAGSAGLSQTAQVELAVVKQEPDAFDTSVENGKFWRTVTYRSRLSAPPSEYE